MNSPHSTSKRLPPVELSMTGLVVGCVLGVAIGMLIELKTGQWKAVISQVSGIAGLMAGLLFEGVRFCWRKWKRHRRDKNDHAKSDKTGRLSRRHRELR